MIYLTIFLDILLNFWWIFPGLFAAYYFYFFLFVRISKKSSKNIKENEHKKTYADLKPEERFQTYDSDEKEIKKKLPLAEKLILDLQEAKPFKVKSVEAIYIADKLEKNLRLDDDGTIVIEKSDAIRVAEMIKYDPSDIVRYMLSMEKKLDPNNKKSTIPLGDFLYLARNARNFNLLAYGSEPEKKDGKVLVKMKTAIYNSWFEDVQVDVRDQKTIDESNSTSSESSSEIIFETNEEYGKEVSDSEHATLDPVTGEMRDPSILKIERLENGRVRLHTKSRKIIEKDDFITYSYRDLIEEEEEAAIKNQKLGFRTIANNTVDLKNENGLLNINPENANPSVHISTQADTPPNPVATYESIFGALGHDEKQELEKTQNVDSLRQRARQYFDKRFFSKIEFSEQLVTDDKFLGEEEIYHLLLQLFDTDYSSFRKQSQRKYIRAIYMGSKKMQNDKEVFYRTINIISYWL